MAISNSGFVGVNVSEQDKRRAAEDMYHDDGTSSTSTKDALAKSSSGIFEKGADSLANAEIGTTKKYFGIKVDAGIADFISSIYNNASNIIFSTIAPKTHTHSLALGKKLGMKEGTALNHAAAISTFGVAVALKAGKDIGEVWSDAASHRKERKLIANRIAPILDEIKGSHSARAFDGVKESDNEVIYAHRQRLKKVANNANVNNLIGLGINAGPNLLLDTKVFRGMWAGHSPGVAKDLIDQQKAGAAGEKGRELRDVMVNSITGPLAGRIQKTNEHNLRMTLQPYSALDMILELDAQVTNNPKSTSYQEPKNRHNPRAYRESYALEDYIARICIQHQRDMAALNDDCTEIREALQDDLMAAVKPVAEAIRKGDISAMALVRLVGEGKIVKKHGRAIADADDVEALLERNAPKMSKLSKHAHVDPGEFYKDSPFSRAELKTAINSLTGENRRKFASRLADSILLDLGMSKQEVKQIREQTEKAKDYDRSLADELIGAAQGKTEKELKEKGLAGSESKRLQQAVEKLEQEGTEAIHDLKTSPTNQHGIEQVLLNLAVPQLAKGDKEYFGKVMKDGHAKVDAMVAEGADKESENEASFVKREEHRGEHGLDQFSLN